MRPEFRHNWTIRSLKCAKIEVNRGIFDYYINRNPFKFLHGVFIRKPALLSCSLSLEGARNFCLLVYARHCQLSSAMG